ncbi:MAG: glycerol-3-phosphate dehydrogenase/oxidase [Bacteroidota bacterium]|jgi:glycerol-3-phosphate dehydrogenase
MPIYSIKNRKKYINQIKTNPFDLVVIGGGITGAGIAWDATLRGLKVLLLEQNDFASGTSSKSTKLIHGGLRYLKQLKFKQVFEVGRERAVVHNIARFLVRPEKMLLPIYKNGSLSRIMAAIALKVYDTLAGVGKLDSFTYYSKEKSIILEPLLPSRHLLGSFLYAEYQTDDHRLTWTLLQSAMKKGAICLNYAKVNQIKTDENSSISAVCFEDTISGEIFKVNSLVVVNAAGPWVLDVISLDAFPPHKELLLSKGTHIVISHTKFPLQQALYYDDFEKKRMIFAIPKGNTTYVGTTDLEYTGDKNNIYSSRSEINYLIKTLQSVFPQLTINDADVISSWVGVRPLIKEPGKESTEVSRKDEIFVSPSGLISIAGGKLTGFRKMAEKVVNLLVKSHFKYKVGLKQSGITKNTLLDGNSFKSESELSQYLINLKKQFSHLGFEPELAAIFMKRYGDKMDIITGLLDVNLNHADKMEWLIEAEIKYGIYHEMIYFPNDFIQRQTGMLWFNRPLCILKKNFIVDIFALEFQWDEKKISLEKKKLDHLLDSVLEFKD